MLASLISLKLEACEPWLLSLCPPRRAFSRRAGMALCLALGSNGAPFGLRAGDWELEDGMLGITPLAKRDVRREEVSVVGGESGSSSRALSGTSDI